MSKSSRVDSERHRSEIVTAASRMLREGGESALSVQSVMGEVGMTHGGFYKHFSSKDELIDLAAAEAFSPLLALMSEINEAANDSEVAWGALVDRYLSEDHRSDLAGGCANTALATDSARSPADSRVRETYIDGFAATVDELKNYQSDASSPEAQKERLRFMITAVGALTLARATAGSPVSDELLSVAKETLMEIAHGRS